MSNEDGKLDGVANDLKHHIDHAKAEIKEGVQEAKHVADKAAGHAQAAVTEIRSAKWVVPALIVTVVGLFVVSFFVGK